MKKNAILTGAACAVLSLPAAAFEPGTSYFGAGLNLWDIGVDTSFGSGSAEPKGLEGRYGYFFSPNFAIEGRLGLGLSDDSGIEISRNYGIYLKGIVDGENVQPYFFVGYTDLELDIGGSSDSDNDMSFGLGASFGSGATRFNVEWGRLYSDSADGIDLDIDAIQLGLVTGF